MLTPIVCVLERLYSAGVGCRLRRAKPRHAEAPLLCGVKPGARRRTLVDLQLTCRIPNGAMVEVKVALPLQPETEPAAVTAEALHNV
jgi:hypothetical protein